MLDHQLRDRRNLDHPVPQGLWILTLQQRAAAAACREVMLHHLIHPLDRQQLLPGSGMDGLATALAITALALLGRLKPMAIAGGWFGGVPRAAADPLPKAGQLGRQGSELGSELLHLLLLSQDEIFGIGWARQPGRLRNASRRSADLRQSLQEMQTGIRTPSRVQQRRTSPRAVPTP